MHFKHTLSFFDSPGMQEINAVVAVKHSSGIVRIKLRFTDEPLKMSQIIMKNDFYTQWSKQPMILNYGILSSRHLSGSAQLSTHTYIDFSDTIEGSGAIHKCKPQLKENKGKRRALVCLSAHMSSFCESMWQICHAMILDLKRVLFSCAWCTQYTKTQTRM